MEKEQTTIRLPRELKEQLQKEADRRGDSFNGLIVIMISRAWELINQGQL